MKTIRIKTGLVCIAVLLVAGCSPRIYRPPALGAEYQFDRGLPPAKKPAHLFDPKAEKELAEKGMLPGERSRKSPATTRKTRTNPPDSTKAVSAKQPTDTTNTTLTPPKKQE